MISDARTFLVALLAILGTAPLSGQAPPARVLAVPVVQQEIRAGHTFIGTVMPLRTSTVGSAVGGRVETFLINEGDRVEKGKPLAKLRTQIIEAEVAAARAEVATRKAELEELKNGSRPEEIVQAKAQVAEAEALLHIRQANRDRLRASARAATVQEVQEAASLADQADAASRRARAGLKLLEEGTRKERIDQARSRMHAAEAELRRLEEQLDRHTIYAPFDGYVVVEHAEVGQYLNQGAPVAEIIELDRVDVQIDVLEDYIGQLQEGTPGRVEVPALPSESFAGDIVLIVPRANRARTFPVKLRLTNRKLGNTVLLKAGMFARVTLPVGKEENALLIPKDALVLGGPSPLVFVIEPGPSEGKGKANPVPVQLGVSDGNRIQVKGRVNQGQFVVVQGNERLRPGQEVEYSVKR